MEEECMELKRGYLGFCCIDFDTSECICPSSQYCKSALIKRWSTLLIKKKNLQGLYSIVNVKQLLLHRANQNDLSDGLFSCHFLF